MDTNQVTHMLSNNADRIAALIAGLTAEQARWKSDPSAWSILEVLCHLLDEERLDFRLRLDYVLHRPGEHFPSNNPQSWPLEHGYLNRDLTETLQAFLEERSQSLKWLSALQNIDWDTPYTAPWGTITAGELLVSWPAHDILHIRQLVEVLWALTNQFASPYPTAYAGEW